ncbi:hypothetical protein AMC87_CH02888 [Rhizobium phaseoli]|nr:hypothetical protein AMC87_CH02888 [Rhizobium phaseoli]
MRRFLLISSFAILVALQSSFADEALQKPEPLGPPVLQNYMTLDSLNCSIGPTSSGLGPIVIDVPAVALDVPLLSTQETRIGGHPYDPAALFFWVPTRSRLFRLDPEETIHQRMEPWRRQNTTAVYPAEVIDCILFHTGKLLHQKDLLIQSLLKRQEQSESQARDFAIEQGRAFQVRLNVLEAELKELKRSHDVAR